MSNEIFCPNCRTQLGCPSNKYIDLAKPKGGAPPVFFAGTHEFLKTLSLKSLKKDKIYLPL